MKAPKFMSSAAVGALVATLLVAGVVVAAAHGGGPTKQVIHACVDDRTGVIEIVHASAGCGQHASPLDWSAEGPEGPRGKQGLPGPAGESAELGLTVVTRSLTFDSSFDHASGSFAGFGVGVDCPGEAVATGGGGSAYGTFTPGNNAPVVVTGPVPLVATYALENDSTSDPADPGDVPTGWWAAAGGAMVSVTVAEPPQAAISRITVDVWAACSPTHLSPDEDG